MTGTGEKTDVKSEIKSEEEEEVTEEKIILDSKAHDKLEEKNTEHVKAFVRDRLHSECNEMKEKVASLLRANQKHIDDKERKC